MLLLKYSENVLRTYPRTKNRERELRTIMAKAVQLKWTPLQREIATLAHSGKTFDEIVEMDYTKSLVSKVLKAIDSGQVPPENREPRTENQGANSKAPIKVVAPSTPIMVGKITITPENWGFTQYGAILVLDTYNKAKRDIDYGGTIGDFLCDVCEFYRRILNYKEVEYARATSEGGGGTEENGNESPQKREQLVEGE